MSTTLRDHLTRAKAILEAGATRGVVHLADTYAAYAALAVFVRELDRQLPEAGPPPAEPGRIVAMDGPAAPVPPPSPLIPPWDHNGECVYCDGPSLHDADCVWLAVAIAALDALATWGEGIVRRAGGRTLTLSTVDVKELAAIVPPRPPDA